MGCNTTFLPSPKLGKSILLASPGPCFCFGSRYLPFPGAVIWLLQLTVQDSDRCFSFLPGCMPACIVLYVCNTWLICSGIWSGPVIWPAVCCPVPVSGPVSCHLYLTSVSGCLIWSCIWFLLSGQMHLVRALLYISMVYLFANLIRWVFDNICVRKMITTFKCYTIWWVKETSTKLMKRKRSMLQWRYAWADARTSTAIGHAWPRMSPPKLI